MSALQSTLAPQPPSMAAAGRPSWQSEADAADRQLMTEHIYQIFQTKRPSTQQYSNKLPEFVKRLEDGLYRSASSKEEYTDLKTLEQRLHDVAKRFVGRPNPASQPGAGVLQGQPMPQNGMQQAPAPTGQMPGMMNMPMQSVPPQFQLPQGQPMQSQGFMPNNGGMGLPESLRNHMPQVSGMVPTQSLQQLDPGGQFPHLMGTSNQGFNTGPAMSQGVMSNGAPVLIRGGQRDVYGNPQQQLLGSQHGQQGMNKLTINGLLPGQLATGPGMLQQQQQMPNSGFVPNSGATGPGGMIPMGNGMVPNGGMMPSNGMVHHGGMVPNGGMVSNGGGMMPNGGMVPGGGGMVPNNGMVPTGGGMVPTGGGMIPTGGGMVPNGGMMPNNTMMSSSGMLAGGGGMVATGGGMMTGGAGMVASNGMISSNGMMPNSGMVPNGGMLSSGGMVPTGGGMVPANGMMSMNHGLSMSTAGSPLLNSFNGPQQMPNSGMGGMGPGPTLPGMVPVGGMTNNGGTLPGMMPVSNTTGFPTNIGVGPLAPGSNMGGQAMPGPGSMLGIPEDMNPKVQEQYVQKQQRWLLFLRHCAKCRAPGEECQLKTQCKFGKQLWQHILACSNANCEYPRCTSSKELLKHHQKCQAPQCPICAPVKDYVKKTRAATHQQHQQHQEQQSQQQQQQQHQQQQQQQQQQHPQPTGSGGGSYMPGQGNMMPNSMMPTQPPPQQQQAEQLRHQMVRMNSSSLLGQKRPHDMMGVGIGPGGLDGMNRMVPAPGPMGMGMGEPLQAQMQPAVQAPAPGQPSMMQSQQQSAPKRPKTEDVLRQNTGTSLLETFDAKQIRVHVDLIRAAAMTQKTQQTQQPANPEDACKVCTLTKLSFEPPVIYCTSCGLKIKRGQIFYSTPPEHGNDLKGYFCHQCFTDQKGERILVEGVSIKKSDLVKRKNDEEIEEGWVQCDHCEGWVHQICGMFNKGRNNNEVHYLCPECLAIGYERGHRQRTEIRPQAMLEAKDLPTSKLSEWITERLNRVLEKERIRRAEQQGKQPHEVPAPEPLTVRMINSVMKKCEVKPKFQETFAADGYGSEFGYRQKVLLLFQSLDGVDVCLFCMYVQEYGRDCPAPNSNVVYLSYLDSVKYFRPEIPSALGPNVSLRTYVYHQLLIGYIEFTKYMGFEQMYIWACPPMQGDDYILYCHPSKQKTPRSDRLRMWYIEMLKLAREEGIVVHLSTLWDTYFEGGRDHRMEKCSATYIPYMDGDYWPGEAENQLATITEHQRGGKGPKKGATSSTGAPLPSRKAGTKGKRYGGGPATTDEQLMSRLGEILGGNMREDFIVVHMQQPCTFCRAHIQGPGIVYRYRAPPGITPPKAAPERKFEGIKLEGGGVSVPQGTVSQLTICQQCFHDEQTRFATGQQQRLPAGVTPVDLVAEKLEAMALWDRDPDGDMESEFFETRQTFLSLCQGNHYQFDTLRRAKHSSMMVLYHLHNPHSPAFASSCNVCNAEIEPGSGYRCTVCSDFDMCASCKFNVGHQHTVVPHKRALDETRQRLTEAERRERNEQLQKTLALLVHACSCHNSACGSNSCRKVKQLFQHAVHCQAKVTGGCQLCKKMWCLLNLHAKSCTRGDCPVPRCKELKELRRRQTNRQEEKRRAAYAAMLRNQMVAQQPRPM